MHAYVNKTWVKALESCACASTIRAHIILYTGTYNPIYVYGHM